MPRPWMSTAEAAARLGVKVDTLYAYVSRGLLHSEREPNGRRSRFRRVDVERLAERGGRGGRAGALEIVVETELTLLDPAGRLFYRGWDVEHAAAAPFEDVAGWLWTGQRTGEAFIASAPLVAAATRAAGALPAGAAPLDRVRAAVIAMRAADPMRDDRRPEAVAACGRAIIATTLEALELCGDAPKPGATVAARLWPRLTALPASKPRVRQLEAALVLLADHELAASTLAARVAASTWADPYLVVTAGLAALGGPLHGGSAEAARGLVREVTLGEGSGAEAVGRRLRAEQLIPGFGHSVYLERDPRADALIAMLATGTRPPARAARDVLATMRERDLPFPNVDFGLALLAETHEMIDGATEVLFAIARIAGWLAHAIEEYKHRLRFRPRASYVGPAADDLAEREDA